MNMVTPSMLMDSTTSVANARKNRICIPGDARPVLSVGIGVFIDDIRMERRVFCIIGIYQARSADVMQ